MGREGPPLITKEIERVHAKMAPLRDKGATTAEIIRAGLVAHRNGRRMRPRVITDPNE